MKGDGRAMRVALTGDAVLNAPPGSPAARVLDALVDRDWGLVALAPAALDDASAAAWRAHALDEVDELRRHGVAIVVVLASADARERAALGADGPDADLDPDAALEGL